MRPRHLEIEGLQSFKDVQRIDFDRLGETGLFGIFGPTGSGKSTVLDAITLALYGNVQRAGRGTQGIVNTDADEVRACFNFDLLKDGARRAYRVERVYRKKKGSDTFVENRLARLSEITKDGEYIVIADKLGDVNGKVEELIGLRPDDFTRSVVLPQNKFQEFLLLEGAKRREMLERIFYLGEYGRQLTEKVGKRLGHVKTCLAEVGGAISSLGDVSPEALEDAENSMKAALALKDKAGRELELAEGRFNQAKEVWDLQAELEDINREEQELISRQRVVEENRRLYDQAIRAGELADAIVKYNRLQTNLENTMTRLETVYSGLSRLDGELQRTTGLYDASREQAENEKPGLIEKRSKLRDALAIETEISDIDTRLEELRKQYGDTDRSAKEKDEGIKALRLQLEGVDKDVREGRQKIDTLRVEPEYRRDIQKGARLEEELERLAEELKKHRQDFDKVTDRIKALEDELKSITAGKQDILRRLQELKDRQAELESKKPGRREDIMRDIDRFHELQLKCQTLRAAAAGIDALKERHEGIKLLAGQQAAELESGKSGREALLQKLEARRQEAEVIRLQYEKNTAFLLARNLKENEACPVCGSTHHPRPAARHDTEGDKDIELQLKGAREKLEQAEQLYREFENKYLVLQEQFRGNEAQRLQVSEELAKARDGYRKLIKQLPGNMQSFDMQRLEEELAGMALHNQNKLAALEEWERLAAQVNEDIQSLLQERSDMSVAYNSKKAELELNCQSLDSINELLKNASGLLDHKTKEYKGFLSAFDIDSARKELESTEDKDRQVRELQGKQEQLQQKDKNLRDALEGLTAEKHKLGSQLSVIQTEGKSLNERKANQENRIRELTGGRDVQTALEAVGKRLGELQMREKELGAIVKELETKHNEMSGRKSALENQKRIYKQGLDAEKESLQDSLKEKGFGSMEQAQKALLSEEECQALNDGIQQYDKQLADIKARKNMYLKKLKGRTVTEEDWNRINQQYSRKKQHREEAISKYEEARVSCSRLKDNYNRWIKLDKEYREHQRKAEMLEQIQRLLRGNSFVEYISEERLKYIAREASETLGVLTKYRYALELDTGQGFVIRDYANGGVCRAVSTLSGGETFLTSLSLALALSKQIQLKGQSPLEFFFLDEGFGTLDSSLLDTVIDALERLSSRQRVIGVISHVPELKNRIARRLIVEPPSVYGEGSRVRMEK
jgi:exonuclease SbcC